MRNTINKLIKALNTPTNPPDQVPAYWFTTKQCAEAMKWSIAHASKKLRKDVKSGKVKVKKFNIYVNKSVVRPVPHYKLV